MYLRVVRFTDVAPERIETLAGRLEEADGPPPGVPSTGIQLLCDTSQRTAVVIQFYETEEDMRIGGEVLSAMDASETPGKRVSVDTCELKVDRRL
jgi:hypothetical protein